MTKRELVSVAEAARLIGLAPATLYKMAYQRRVRSFKVLGALRFDRGDLLALVTEREPRCQDHDIEARPNGAKPKAVR